MDLLTFLFFNLPNSCIDSAKEGSALETIPIPDAKFLNAAGSLTELEMDPIDLIQQSKITRYFRATRKLNAPNLISHITQRAAGQDLLFLE